MAKVCGRNINVNFNYCIKAVIHFMYKIVINKQTAFHKVLFRKLEKDLKCFIISRIRLTQSFAYLNLISKYMYITDLISYH